MKTFEETKYKAVIKKYHDSSMKYCLDVLEDRLVAGNLIKLACLRHLNDLKRIDTDPSFKYIYDVKKAEGMINFAELIPDVSANKCLPLAQFQKFIYAQIQGWIDPSINGARFKTVYLSMARTNGKTQIASVLSLRDFLLGQPASSRQVAVASNTNEQIKQLYNYIRKAWRSLKQTEWFKPFANGIVDNSQEMRIDSSNTRLMHMSSEGTTGDSVHATTTIFDEYHLQKTTDYIDSFSSGNVQNPQARVIIISTAGTDPRVPMREDYTAYSEALEKKKLDDTVLFLCWEQDNDDEAFKPETWIKSNPLMEVPVMKTRLTQGLITEKNKQLASGNLRKFLVKNMNRWQNAKKNAYIPLDLIEKSIIDGFDLRNREVYLGYDASLSNDDTSLVALIPYQLNGNNKFYVWEHSFIPTRVAGGIEAKMKRDTLNYQQAEKDGYCDIAKNRFGTVDQNNVYQFMLETISKYNWRVKAFGYDAWGTGAFIRALNEKNSDWLLFPIRQGAHSLSEPTKWLQDSFNAGDIKIPNDPILKAALSNAILTNKDNQLLIDKNMNSAKIDTADALVDACYQGMLHFTEYTNEEVKEDKKNPFSGMSNEDINEYFKNDFSF